jgi:hypothetical protein
MPGTVIAIETTDQPEFATAWKYRAQVHAALEKSGYTLTVEDDSNAVWQVVKDVVSDTSAGITFISGVGHGTPRSFLGFSRLPVFQKDHYDPGMVANRIIHLTTCEAADELGLDFVKNGSIAFIGYNSLVSWSDDKTAAGWFKCDAAIDLALAAGKNVADAHAAGAKAFGDTIQELRDSHNGPGADFLEQILECLCSPVTDKRYGDPGARLQ